MKRLVCAVLLILGLGFLPMIVDAGAVWPGEVTKSHEPPETDNGGWFRWLWSKVATPKLPIGTELEIKSSAFASSPRQTDSTPCITAAGTRVRQGVVASNFLPMGTILKINGQLYIVEDRMNPRYAGRFVDIWFPSTAQALQFGRQKLQATIVGYGTPGQELTPTTVETAADESHPIKPSVIERASLRFIAVTRAIARAIPANVNQYDVNCFE